MKKLNLIGLLIGFAILLVGCSKTDFDPVKPDYSKKRAATLTISKFIETYASDKGDLFPVRTNSGTSNLFSVDTIPSKGAPIIISGAVISSDVKGNIYKYMIIQDTITGDALKISVDAGSLTGEYPIGQYISIQCNGLVIGKYGDLYQLGVATYNIDDYKPAKTGWEPGRIPYNIFSNITLKEGYPKPSSIKIDTMTIVAIKSAPRSLHSKIVCIRNVKFNGYGEVEFNYGKLTASQLYFGLPKPSFTGVPVSRELEDQNGNKITVSTSEFSSFASKPLPSSTIIGDVTVIVGWYRDKEGSTQFPNLGTWQLTLRSLEDLGRGFESYHSTIK